MSGIEGVQMSGFTPYVAPTLPTNPATAATAGSGVQSASGHAFGSMVLDGIDRLEQVQDRSDQLAVKAATGDLDNIHDYTIAATEASVSTQLTVAVRNRALEAFNEIMRMQVG
ncbi:flagellar hook-basal body complex protein FliE [Nocardioides sp. LS1]|uniref:flagellar hook-basal body complex protein FliE n=1 Tax=Nocardioides sp. LS1 TaxID=1027620 RepID=UPI0021AB5464|nr:flagellar hook-basal body complex protein FliE [Nocardioides sp. LS1]